MSETLTLYPTNWLYNASVIGFLRVMASGVGEAKIEKWLKDDGTVEIPKTELEILTQPSKIDAIDTSTYNWSKWYVEESNNAQLKTKEEIKKVFSRLFSKKGIYSNLVSLPPKEDLKERWESSFKSLGKEIDKWIKPSSYAKGKEIEMICAFCFSIFKIKRGELEKFAFQNKFVSYLGGSIGNFPNTFWNNEPNQYICPQCAFFIIHHHIPLVKTKDGEIFINASSFKVMWYLNKFSEAILSRQKRYQLREILGISLMELSQRIVTTLGAWSIMNIEMVIKKYGSIDYYSLPYKVSCVLLQKEIASLINKTKEPYILEIILSGRFDELINLSHKLMRYAADGEGIPSTDKYLSQIRDKSSSGVKELAKILPELYVRIDSTLKEEVII